MVPDAYYLSKKFVRCPGAAILRELLLNDGPQVLNTVEVRGVTWPVEDSEWLLLEVLLASLGSMGRSFVVLVDPIAIGKPFSHLLSHSGLKDMEILHLVHRSFHEVKTPCSMEADYAPHHNLYGMPGLLNGWSWNIRR